MKEHTQFEGKHVLVVGMARSGIGAAEKFRMHFLAITRFAVNAGIPTKRTPHGWAGKRRRVPPGKRSP